MSCNDTFEMSTREALETRWLGFLLGANHKHYLAHTKFKSSRRKMGIQHKIHCLHSLGTLSYSFLLGW